MMMHKNTYQERFLKSNLPFDAFIHQYTFFCRTNDANLEQYLFCASSIGAFGTCGNPFPAQEKKTQKWTENE